MNDFSFYMPVRIVFGAGVSARAGEVARSLGRKAIIVTGRSSMRSLGVLDRIMGSLRAAGCAVEILDGIRPNPTTVQIMEGAAAARRLGAEVLVALGGGSTLDAAKGVAVMATNPGDVWEYVKKSQADPRPVEAAPLPLVAIPTTAGTGSEVTPFAVVTNPVTKEKPPIMSERIFPRAALIDPELSALQPPEVTAATGIDVFAHVFENYTQAKVSPIAEPFDLEAMRLVARWLPVVRREGSDMEGRSRMAFASAMGGICLAAGGGAQMIHGMEHPVSGHFDVAHGEGLAALLPACARHFLKAIPARAAEIARALGAQADESNGPARCLEAVEALLESVGLRVGLRSLGVKESSIDRLAEDAMRTMGRAVVKSPAPVTKDDLARIYRESM